MSTDGSNDRWNERVQGPRRAAWPLALACVIAIAVPFGARADAPSQMSYRLNAVYPIPATEPQQLVDPVMVKADIPQRELIALETQPPSVVVMTPDGSILRRFGAGILSAPSDLAPVYPDDLAYRWDGDVARVMVTEATLGRLHVFDTDGTHVRTIQDDWEPTAIVGITVERPERALLADAKDGQIVALDWEGNRLSTGTPGAEANLRRPTLLAGGRFRHLVFDTTTHHLLWFDETGTVLEDLALDELPQLSAVTDVSAVVVDDSTALLALDSGLWALGWKFGFSESPPVIQRLTGAGLDEPFVALDLVRVSGQGEFPFYRRLQLFGLQGPPVALTRYVSVSADFWLDPEYVGTALHRGCPFVWERPGHAWRLALGVQDAPEIVLTNGAVLRLENGAIRATGRELGYVDDWVIEPSGMVVTSIDGLPVAFRPGPSGLRGQASSWEPQADCMVSGIGFRPSISAGAAGSSEAAQYVLTPISPEQGGWWKRLGLSFDVIGRHLRSDGQLTPPNTTLLGYSHQTIGAPILSDVAVRGDGRRAAVVDRLGGRVVVFEPDPEVDWEAAARWPVPGRPYRAAWSPDGDLFVLTADGWIWCLDEAGRVKRGWDAAGMAPAPRPTLVDIAVAGDGKVYALDKYERRLLEFIPSGEGVALPPPSLPPPCRVQSASSAQPPTVQVGHPVTVTLAASGACGRVSAENDILILMQPPENDTRWTATAFRDAAAAFVESLDPDKDRVGLTVFDAVGTELVPIGTDFAAVPAAAEQVVSLAGEYHMSARPLLRASEQLARRGRPGVNRVILLFTTGDFTRLWAVDRLVIDGETLREAGVRVIVVCSKWERSLLPALLAYQPDDYYLVPDAETMRAVYAQLGREFGARVLLRDMALEVTFPADMSYVEASAEPSAAWDPASRTLRWTVRDVGFAGWEGGFRVRPSQAGHQPTVIRADADVVDGFGNRFPVSFPIPWVEVVEPPTPTPSPTITSTPTASPTNTPTPTITPAALLLPLALREAKCRPELTPVDAVLVIDASRSMAGAKLAAARRAARVFGTTVALGRDRVAVVAFHSEAWTAIGLTADLAALNAAIDQIEPGSGTRMDRGLAEALTILDAAPRSRATEAVVLLTDGQQDGMVEDLVTLAQSARDDGVQIHAVGLGEDADLELLRRLTGDPQLVHAAGDETTLEAVYRTIAAEIPCPAARYWGRR